MREGDIEERGEIERDRERQRERVENSYSVYLWVFKRLNKASNRRNKNVFFS